jgi:membrane protein required for colicin V production
MNGFDIFVLVIISVCMVRGYFKGIIGEISGIIGVIISFYGANIYYSRLTPYLRDLIETPGTRSLICFFVLFCGILILISLLAALIRKFLNLVFLGWVDRFFGLVFGTAKGVLIISVLFMMMTTFVSMDAKLLSGSKTAPHVATLASAMSLFFSKSMETDFPKHLEGIRANWKQ